MHVRLDKFDFIANENPFSRYVWLEKTRRGRRDMEYNPPVYHEL